MISESVAIIGLAVSLIGTLLVSTWRLSALATQMKAENERLASRVAQYEAKSAALDKVAMLEMQIAQQSSVIGRMSSEWPRALGRISVLEEKAQHSKEMRAMARASRPDLEDT